MDFTEVDGAILRDLYENGDDRPINIADRTGKHRTSVSHCLSGKDDSLESRGLVKNKGHGVWSLTEDGVEAARRLIELQGFGSSDT